MNCFISLSLSLSLKNPRGRWLLPLGRPRFFLVGIYCVPLPEPLGRPRGLLSTPEGSRSVSLGFLHLKNFGAIGIIAKNSWIKDHLRKVMMLVSMRTHQFQISQKSILIRGNSTPISMPNALRTCRRCKQQFLPAENHRKACRYHSATWTGGEISKVRFVCFSIVSKTKN